MTDTQLLLAYLSRLTSMFDLDSDKLLNLEYSKYLLWLQKRYYHYSVPKSIFYKFYMEVFNNENS